MTDGEQQDQRAMLVAAGFTCRGACGPGASADQMSIEGSSERTAGVYAYVVGNQVCYVGSAQRGLRSRLKHYENTKRLRTARRVRTEILRAIANGQKVEVFTLSPPPFFDWNGLPVDLVAGLEEGLIRHFRPRWNVRGRGGEDNREQK